MRLRDIVFLVLEGYSGDGSNFDVNATAGLNDVGEPNIALKIRIDGPFNHDDLGHEIYEAVIHEMTHLGQATFDDVGASCGLRYFTCLTESEAFASGLFARAERTGRPVASVIDEYLQSQVRADRLEATEAVEVRDTWLRQIDQLDHEIEEMKRIYARDATPKILKAIEQQTIINEPLVYAGYPYIADIDETDEFTIEYAIERPPN